MFVVYLGITPKEYYELTLGERNAIVSAWNRAKRR